MRMMILAAWPLIVPPRPLRRAPENRARRASTTVKKGRSDASTDTTAPSLLTGKLRRLSVMKLENVTVVDFLIPWCQCSSDRSGGGRVDFDVMAIVRSSSFALRRRRPRG